MKFKNRMIQGPNVEIVAIPRPPLFESKLDAEGKPVLDADGKPIQEEICMDVVFVCKAVLDYSAFDALCPVPQPPKMIRPGMTAAVENPEDAGYVAKVNAWNTKRTNWMMYKSISETPDLVWEKIKPDDPESWHLLREEMREAGFNGVEINMVINGALTVNAVDRNKMEEAKKRFLATHPQADQN